MALLCACGGTAFAAEAVTPELAAKAARVRAEMEQRVSNEERQAAADALKALRQKVQAAQQATPTLRTKNGSALSTLGVVGTDFDAIPTGPNQTLMDGKPKPPDYNTTANWAFSPELAKFVDPLPPLGCQDPSDATEKCMPIAVPDTTTYPGADYYEISMVQFTEKMHSDLNPTHLRGYVQTNMRHRPGDRPEHCRSGRRALHGADHRRQTRPPGARQIHQRTCPAATSFSPSTSR